MELAEEISGWIKEQIEGAGAQGAVVGLSGGLDSSVTAVLCKRVTDLLGLIMPIHSDPLDEEYASLLASKLDIQVRRVDLSPVYDALARVLPDPAGLPAANLKPRLRMATLYYFANKENRLVVGTGNKSEIMMGYFTKYGDGAVDILPLGGLLKRQVRELARELGIPPQIIAKPPSAGLWAGQTDEGELGITYDQLDRILTAFESGGTVELDPQLVERVKRHMVETQHKRVPIPVFEP
ncbi:MAG: NAD+ synthase [Anaerolineae bacterium]